MFSAAAAATHNEIKTTCERLNESATLTSFQLLIINVFGPVATHNEIKTTSELLNESATLTSRLYAFQQQSKSNVSTPHL